MWLLCDCCVITRWEPTSSHPGPGAYGGIVCHGKDWRALRSRDHYSTALAGLPLCSEILGLTDTLSYIIYLFPDPISYMYPMFFPSSYIQSYVLSQILYPILYPFLDPISNPVSYLISYILSYILSDILYPILYPHQLWHDSKLSSSWLNGVHCHASWGGYSNHIAIT